MGSYAWLFRELAPADLDLSRPGCADVWARRRPPPPGERSAARVERRAALLGDKAGHGLHRPQLHGSGTVCAASHQRRVRGLDRRAQDDAQHAVLPARAWRLPLVRAPAKTGPHGSRRLALRTWAYGQ